MRKIIYKYIISLLIFVFSSCKDEKSELEISRIQKQLVVEYETASSEGNLNWNIPYRKALINANRPMGCVFEYGFSFANFNSDIEKSEIWINVGILFPEKMIINNQMQIYLNDQPITISKYDVLIRAKNADVGDDIDIYFKVPFSKFVSANKIFISIGLEKDLLITNKSLINEKLLSYHEKIVKGEIKVGHGVLLCPVRF